MSLLRVPEVFTVHRLSQLTLNLRAESGTYVCFTSVCQNLIDAVSAQIQSGLKDGSSHEANPIYSVHNINYSKSSLSLFRKDVPDKVCNTVHFRSHCGGGRSTRRQSTCACLDSQATKNELTLPRLPPSTNVRMR
jgi:hypothetical protein